MTSSEETVQFILELDNPELEDGQKLKFSKNLLRDLRDLDEVEKADRTEDLTSEEGSKAGLDTLIGSVKALVPVKKVKEFFEYLKDLLQNKPIKVSVKVGKNETKIEANNTQELAEAEKTVLNLIAAMNRESNVQEDSTADRS